MKVLKIVLLTMVALGLIISGVFAADVAEGNALFNDPIYLMRMC